MKALIENLKSLIEEEKRNFASYERKERRMYELRMQLKNNHEILSKELFDLAAEEYDKKWKSSCRLNSLRKALANLRDADGQIEGKDYSIFEPEFDIQK